MQYVLYSKTANYSSKIALFLHQEILTMQTSITKDNEDGHHREM